MKNLISFCVVFALIFLSACAPSNDSAAPKACLASSLTYSQFSRSTLIIEFHDLAGEFDQFRRRLVQAHSAVARDLGKLTIIQLNEDAIALHMPPSSPAAAVLETYVRDGKIKTVEPDQRTFLIDPSDPEEISGKSGIQPSLATAPSGETVIVAVIDSGVDYTHKDLRPFMWKNPRETVNGRDDDGNGFIDDVNGWDFANNDNDPMADDRRSYHGTHVAGIVKQAALLKLSGIQLKIMAIKYLDETSTGLTSNAIRAIDYAVKNGAKILNNSWGSMGRSDALANAIERSRKAGALFIAAAGNGDSQGNGIDIDRRPFYPAAFPHTNIVSVGAANSSKLLTQWSNFGAAGVDLAAPGNRIRSTRNGDSYATLSGTSMAAPYVAGVAAVVWSLRPELGYQDVRDIVLGSVDRYRELNGLVATSGHVNTDRAAQVAVSYRHDTDVNPPPIALLPPAVCSR